jgi:L-cysteine S-thiosulfotransferase
MIAARPRIAGVLCLLAVMHSGGPANAQERPGDVRPGKDFQSAETRALQDDETRNPGMLWVEQGAKLWNEPAGTSGKSCASCHGVAETSMKGVAARYPVAGIVTTAHNGVGGRNLPPGRDVVTIDSRIDTCRTANQGGERLAWESSERLALSAYVTFQSRGMPRQSVRELGHDLVLREGHRLFNARQGQLNLSCAQCHDDLVGKKLRGDTISQAQTHGWPAYRFEWQTIGSLQRRLRACSLGVRAEVLDYGHDDYLALEYYLAWRGEGLPMESPGVRR